MGRPFLQDLDVKETTMTKQAKKTRLVRLGDAKRLTKGDVGIGDELATNHVKNG